MRDTALLQVSTRDLSRKSISQVTGLAKATASRQMHTLCHEGYAEQDVSTKMFRVGQSLIRHVAALLQASPRTCQTKNTITTIDAYLDELAKVRDTCYALDEQEHDRHIFCIAARQSSAPPHRRRPRSASAHPPPASPSETSRESARDCATLPAR